MSGVVVIRRLLSIYAPLTAIIPAARIVVGDFSLSTPRPCIVVMQVDSTDFKHIKQVTTRFVTDRVQVSPLFNGPNATQPGTGYAGLLPVMKLLPKACLEQSGLINNIRVESISLEVEGPDLIDTEASLYSRSRDFIVRYWEDL